jgi:CHAT domain-containing protein
MADRQEAYLELVRALLECEGGTEADILEAHPELVDEGLVMTLLGVAKMMAKQNDPESASTIEWLTDFAAQLAQALGLGTESDFGEIESKHNFLMTVFQVIAESKGNPQIIYPLFRDNLAHLNESLIPLLTTWHQAIYADADEDRKQGLAAVLNTFANRIQEFPLGSRIINLEIAIECFELALSVLNPDAYPENWATTQNNLAIAYWDRIRGERAANLERSIACFKLALSVYTLDTYPEYWATTQNNLAAAYSNRIRGKRAANLERSIEYFELALAVYTLDTYPEDWAMTQNNLAAAYGNRIRGERAANLERSIECCKLALSAYPEQWATVQNNLAIAYGNRIRGERAANLERSIECCKLALSAYTLEAYPEQWATVQNNLAIAYGNRIRGERAANLERSIECYKLALSVYTPEAFPIDALNANRGLGKIYFTQGEWQLAIDAFAVAIRAAETSRSWATSEDERQRIIREAISVYEYTIQAYINLGRIDLAITTSERARSRQLLDFMRTNDLYSDAEIPAQVQTYLAEYEALERQIQAQQFLEPPDNSNPARQLTTSHRTSRAIAEASETVRGLETQKQAVWRKIWALDPELAAKRQITPIDLPTIQGLITNPNTALLSFYTTNDDTHIFIITQTGAPQIFTLPGQGLATLQQWLQQQWSIPYQFPSLIANSDKLTPEQQEELRTALQEYAQDNNIDENLLISLWRDRMNDTLANLADRLQLPQLIDRLPDGITELKIVPHLYLHQIPFAALPLSGGLLGDRFTIHYTPSCQILKYCHDRSPLPTDRTQHGTIENADGTLPGAEFEGTFVANLFNLADRYRLQGRTQATIAGFQSLMATTDRPVTNLHFANHANSRLDAPLESALQLADGNLGLDRLMISRYPHLHEVFLSCCETHLGATKITDDILTIGTGFLCAGARSVISTLWSVDDLATALFSMFYYHNRYDNISRARSLKKAQVRLRNLTGDEFKLNYRDDLEQHLQAYAKANKADRKELEARFKRGEIDAVTFDRDRERLTKAYNEALKTIDLLDRHCEKDKPFADPYYWAGFICQGLA